MGCLWKILGVLRISHIRNTDIKNQLNIQLNISHIRNTDIKNQLNIQLGIVDRIGSRHLRYFVHGSQNATFPMAIPSPVWSCLWKPTLRTTKEALD